MNIKIFSINILMLAGFFQLHGQKVLTSEMMEASAMRFSLSEGHGINGNAREQWLKWIDENQFVGIAEVHNSAQLSFFTTGILGVLKEKGFKNMALELGPHSASVLQEITFDPSDTRENIKAYSRKYAKPRKPLFVFASKIEDAIFMEEASRLGFTFWGLDQEYLFSYEMHLDNIHKLAKQPTPELQAAYEKAKTLIHKNILKSKVSGQSVYCWYLSNEIINDYLKMMENDDEAKAIIDDMRKSWDIYCRYDSGRGSNQQRADYMKSNFAKYYVNSDEESPKVFLKLGGVHLTHGLSQFKVDDMGKFLTEKTASDQSGFLSIRHLIAYRNGKSNVGKRGWKSTSLFLELGRKDQWTALDLRPFRKMMENDEIEVSKGIAFELRSYDILLLSPDDQYPKPNY
ncbi:MAG: hypothetical protein ABJG47_19410 [Ekhidna sp.]